MTQVHIKQKVSRKVRFVHVQESSVVVPELKLDSKQYTELDGVLLIPVAEAHLFNTSASTIRREIRKGNLTPYHDNGTIKTSNNSTKVYFDLHQWMNLDKNKDS